VSDLQLSAFAQGYGATSVQVSMEGKQRKWQVAHARDAAAFPKLYRKLGLIPEDNKFNRDAKAYARRASQWHINNRIGKPKPRIVHGMKY
jgi:hypothetical protein